MKPWYKSRIIWLNILAAVVIIGTSLADPTLVSDPRVVAIGSSILSAANIALRVLTTMPIGEE